MIFWARIRLAWAVLTGRVRTTRTFGELLSELSIARFVEQEYEIKQLREENVQLRTDLARARADVPTSPFRG